MSALVGIQQVYGRKAVSWIGGAGTFGSIFMVMPEEGLAVGIINNYDYAFGIQPRASDVLTLALGDGIRVSFRMEPDGTVRVLFGGAPFGIRQNG